MPPKISPAAHPTKSIAEAKLERQRIRIEEADAALNAPWAATSPAKDSRGKTREGKLAASVTSRSPRSPSKDGGVPVSEVRVNTFRAISRESDLVRPMSSLSQHTNDTAPSDRDRQESAMLDDGFQIFKGRRYKKRMGELNAYEDKPEERQATVEAIVDVREIYDVFGNALPGPAYLETHFGKDNGEVQFIQHPNGDVSAHQWSKERFMWENIGQFSNIRKKVEGQLAADRLKGQTAQQSLQQNRLAYFRTIAKQREALVRGVPFGVKEIQAAMPNPPHNELAAAPTGLKQPAKDHLSTLTHQTNPILYDKQDSVKPQDATSTQPARSHVNATSWASTVPRGPRADVHGHGISQPQPLEKQDDPFYSASPFQKIYGGYPDTQNQPNRIWKVCPPTPAYHFTTQRQQNFNHDFRFPPATTTNRTSQFLPNSSYMLYHGVPPTSVVAPAHRFEPNVAPDATRPQYTASVPANQFAYPQMELPHQAPSQAVAYSIPKPSTPTPFGNRGSMSDQLWKISETAKERSQSQASISRTVLYDPYQNPPSTSKDTSKARTGPIGPLASKDNAGRAKVQAAVQAVVDKTIATFGPLSSEWEQRLRAKHEERHYTLAAQRARLDEEGPKIPQEVKENRAFLFPPTMSSEQPSGLTTASSNLQPTLQSFKNSVSPTDKGTYSLAGKATSSDASRKAYDEELNDWWTSGNKFARQEEFYQSIMAVHKPSNQTMSAQRPHQMPTSIGPRPPTLHEPNPDQINPTTTRLLIPVLENLASYVEGPPEKCRDYFSQWSPAPEWAIDRSEKGNDTFFDKDWGQPPARVGRDPRYSNRSWMPEPPQPSTRFPPVGSGVHGGVNARGMAYGIDRRFGFPGHS